MMVRGLKLFGMIVCLALLGTTAYADEPKYIDHCAPEYVAPEGLPAAEKDKAGWYFDLVLVDEAGNPVAADGEIVIEIYEDGDDVVKILEEEAESNPHPRVRPFKTRSFKVRRHQFRHHPGTIGIHRHPLHFRAGPVIIPHRPHAKRFVVRPGFVVDPHRHVIHGRKGSAVIVIPVR
jgi:hypothetical protein